MTLNEKQFEKQFEQQRLFDPGLPTHGPERPAPRAPELTPQQRETAYDADSTANDYWMSKGPFTLKKEIDPEVMDGERGWGYQRHLPDPIPHGEATQETHDMYTSQWRNQDYQVTEVPLNDVQSVQSEIHVPRLNQLWNNPELGQETPEGHSDRPKIIKSQGTNQLLDGNHRTTVARHRGEMFIQADVYPGDTK